MFSSLPVVFLEDLVAEILPPDTIVPPLTVFGGNPGVYLGDLPESQLFVQKQPLGIRWSCLFQHRRGGKTREQFLESKRPMLKVHRFSLDYKQKRFSSFYT